MYPLASIISRQSNSSLMGLLVDLDRRGDWRHAGRHVGRTVGPCRGGARRGTRRTADTTGHPCLLRSVLGRIEVASEAYAREP